MERREPLSEASSFDHELHSQQRQGSAHTRKHTLEKGMAMFQMAPYWEGACSVLLLWDTGKGNSNSRPCWHLKRDEKAQGNERMLLIIMFMWPHTFIKCTAFYFILFAMADSITHTLVGSWSKESEVNPSVKLMWKYSNKARQGTNPPCYQGEIKWSQVVLRPQCPFKEEITDLTVLQNESLPTINHAIVTSCYPKWNSELSTVRALSGEIHACK